MIESGVPGYAEPYCILGGCWQL